MNKAIIFGAIIAIVIGIIIASVVNSLEFSNNETIPVKEGRNLSVEFTESINLKSP